MKYTLKQIEDALMAQIYNNVSYLPQQRVLPVPPELSVPILESEMLPNIPVALVAFEGFVNEESESESWDDGYVWKENYLWIVFVIAKSFRSIDKMLRGDAINEGAYDLIEDVRTALQGVRLLDGMDTTIVQSAKMVMKRPGVIIYRLDIVFGQSLSKAMDECQ